MSNLKYAIVEDEMVVSTVDAVAEEKHFGPYIITKLSKRGEKELTRRVEAALDKDFANGSMPA